MNKILYHVSSFKKVLRYKTEGCIKPPVRAWTSIEAALNFSKQTGRRVILRLKNNKTFVPFEGHKGNAVISREPYCIKDF